MISEVDLRNWQCKVNSIVPVDYVEHMEQVVMAIMDRNYDLMYDYFCNVLEREEEYKILTARRCQVLFQIFVPIILKNDPDIKINGTFISSHAIAKCKEHLLDSSVLILDDIIIHGRRLQELYEELDAKYENDNIHIYAHKMDRNADSMNEKLKKKLEYDSLIFAWEWRELSTQLVNVIQATVTPYVSFVETYVGSRMIDLEKAENAFIVYDNLNEDQKRVGTTAYVLFEKEALPCIIHNGGYDACVRYYENKKMRKAVYAPYVFMKALSRSDIRLFCTAFAEHLGNKFNALRNELLTEYNNDLGLKYKAYLINVLLNRVYGLYLNGKYQGLFDFSVAEWSTLAMCFGIDVTNDIEGIVYSDVWNLMELEFCRTQYDAESVEDSELINGLEQVTKENAEDERLPLYFYHNRQLDEESVRRQKKRKKGLSVKTFYSKLGVDVHKASKLQLNSWDAGIAACDAFIVNNELVSLYVKAGEQSFRYIVDKLEKLGENANKISECDSEETLENWLVKQFLKKNKEYLCEWKVPKIYC